MKKHFIAFVTIFISAIGFYAQELLPTSTTGEIVKHTYFTLSYSPYHKQAEWVYYELTPEFILGNQTRTDDFRPDPIESVSAQLSD